MIKSPFHICASENLLRIRSGDYSHLSVHTRSDQQEVFTHGKTSERMSEGLGEGPANATQRWLDIWLYMTEFSLSPGSVVLLQCHLQKFSDLFISQVGRNLFVIMYILLFFFTLRYLYSFACASIINTPTHCLTQAL